MLSKQLQQVHPNVLAKVLKQGTVYQNEEIVVINKPYGLPVHGEGRPAVPHPCLCGRGGNGNGSLALTGDPLALFSLR